MKKSTNRENHEWDRAKLDAFKKELQYEVAMFFRFYTDTKDIKFARCAVP